MVSKLPFQFLHDIWIGFDGIAGAQERLPKLVKACVCPFFQLKAAAARGEAYLGLYDDNLGGEAVSLNDVEHKRLRLVFTTPKPFAHVCSAVPQPNSKNFPLPMT